MLNTCVQLNCLKLPRKRNSPESRLRRATGGRVSKSRRSPQENQEPRRRVIILEVAPLQAEDQRRVVILPKAFNPEEEKLEKIEIIKEKEADPELIQEPIPEPIQEQTEEEVLQILGQEFDEE